jgi:hypothetical protein
MEEILDVEEIVTSLESHQLLVEREGCVNLG